MIPLDFDGSHRTVSGVVAGSCGPVTFAAIRVPALPAPGSGVCQVAVEPLGPLVRLWLHAGCALTGEAS